MHFSEYIHQTLTLSVTLRRKDFGTSYVGHIDVVVVVAFGGTYHEVETPLPTILDILPLIFDNLQTQQKQTQKVFFFCYKVVGCSLPLICCKNHLKLPPKFSSFAPKTIVAVHSACLTDGQSDLSKAISTSDQSAIMKLSCHPRVFVNFCRLAVDDPTLSLHLSTF